MISHSTNSSANVIPKYQGRDDNLPIIFIHKGNNDYLRYTLACAKLFNPETRVILLGDETNEHYQTLGIEHFPYSTYVGEESRLFDKVFKYVAGERAHPEWLVNFWFKRMFHVYYFVFTENINRFWMIASDVFVLCNLTEKASRYAEYDYTEECGGACMHGYIGSLCALRGYLNKINELFQDEKYLEEQKKDFIAHPDWSYTEMRAYNTYKESANVKTIDLKTILEGEFFDVAIYQQNDMEMENGYKNIYVVDGGYYVKHLPTQQYVRLNTLNMSGATFLMIRGFYEYVVANHRPISKSSGLDKLILAEIVNCVQIVPDMLANPNYELINKTPNYFFKKNQPADRKYYHRKKSSKFRIDFIYPSLFAWCYGTGFGKAMEKLGVLHRSFPLSPGDNSAASLFEYLNNGPESDLILIMTGDAHLPFIHDTPQKRQIWKQIHIPKLNLAGEPIINTVWEGNVTKTLSALECFDYWLAVDERDIGFLKRFVNNVSYVNGWIDENTFQISTPYQKRKARLMFRGYLSDDGIPGAMSERKRILNSLINANRIDNYPNKIDQSYDLPFEFIKLLNEYQAILNLPSTHGGELHSWGYSSRIYEVLACGSLLFNYRIRLQHFTSHLFEEYEDFIPFDIDDESGLIASIDKYLAQEEASASERIALRGREKVLALHTAEKRVQQIIRYIQDGIPIERQIIPGLVKHNPKEKLFDETGRNLSIENLISQSEEAALRKNWPLYDQIGSQIIDNFQNNRRLPEALEIATRMLNKYSNLPGMLRRRGILRKKSGDISGAEQDFLQSEKGNSNDIDLLVSMGKLYLDTQRHADALAYLSAALNINNNDADVWAGIALVTRHRKDPTLHSRARQITLAIDPSYGTILK